MIQSGRPGLTPAARERLKELERENRELKRSNEILRKASACFAQAELARRGKSSWRVSISIGTRTGSSRSAGRGRSPRPPTTPTRRVWPTRAGEVPGPSVTTPAVAGCRRRGTGTSRSTASASCGGSSGAKALHTAVAQTFGAAAALQVGQQPLTHGRVLGGAFPHAQGVFLAGDIDTQRDDDAVGPPVPRRRAGARRGRARRAGWPARRRGAPASGPRTADSPHSCSCPGCGRPDPAAPGFGHIGASPRPRASARRRAGSTGRPRRTPGAWVTRHLMPQYCQRVRRRYRRDRASNRSHFAASRRRWRGGW